MKGIIVVDKIPKNCRNIRGDEENGCPFGGMVCQITGQDVMRHVTKGTKSDICPIKKMPEKLQSSRGMANRLKSEIRGFNYCIDRILKGASHEA